MVGIIVCNVVDLSIQKSWSCCWWYHSEKQLVMWLVLAFLLVILFGKLISFVILLVTDRKMIAGKQVLVVLLGLNSIDRNKKKAKYGEKSWS